MITQGKWERRTNHLPVADYARTLVFCNGRQVANTLSSTIEKKEQEVNAALIAAAPELLAACKALLNAPLDNPDHLLRAQRDAERAIAKAENN